MCVLEQAIFAAGVVRLYSKECAAMWVRWFERVCEGSNCLKKLKIAWEALESNPLNLKRSCYFLAHVFSKPPTLCVGLSLNLNPDQNLNLSFTKSETHSSFFLIALKTTAILGLNITGSSFWFVKK